MLVSIRLIPDRSRFLNPCRRMLMPIGPVVVFEAQQLSTLAISVVGADTVAALGAGCPVVVERASCWAPGGVRTGSSSSRPGSH